MHGAPRASLRRPVTMEAPMPVRDQSPFGVAVLLILGLKSPRREEDRPPWSPWKRTSPSAEVSVSGRRRLGLLRSLEVALSDVM
ncbi:hypothetical protein MUK42_36244 [Musa troglodytarum]|uniref:Uncharacterized protein n=1 Tax=Musa troglodytarum TaxID=320322 RepID=A0A9E7KNI3_9LILI|nr:hypothetical protein MUK42_36244 [Musa troglodytarum]